MPRAPVKPHPRRVMVWFRFHGPCISGRGKYIRGMPTRARMPRDTNQRAFAVVQQATGQAPIVAPPPDTRNPAAVALSKLGASKGGQARAAALSPRQRKTIAKRAAAARWAKKE